MSRFDIRGTFGNGDKLRSHSGTNTSIMGHSGVEPVELPYKATE
jgi:hypothetical protein